MWISRDFESFLNKIDLSAHQPIKILRGPRQVGKTSLLIKSGKYKIVYLDDIHIRKRANDDPKLFLDEFDCPLILDEATLAPNLFFELKLRVDEYKRLRLTNPQIQAPDIWITGSNQTLLEKNVRESLVGRASYFDLNTLSIHELKNKKLSEIFMCGGFPELHSNKNLSPITYFNDFISTFVEKDIVAAAGIERKAAFTSSIKLMAARIGQLLNASDIAKNVGVDTTTIQSWIEKLEQNALLKLVRPFYNNLNQRLIKTPKIYFEDIGLASRFQGWSSFTPLFTSSQYGHLIENLALIEINRFFQNRGLKPEVLFLLSKEKIEIDFLIKLPDNKWIAAEVKTTPCDFTDKQIQLLNSVNLNIVGKFVLTPADTEGNLAHSKIISFKNIYPLLESFQP